MDVILNKRKFTKLYLLPLLTFLIVQSCVPLEVEMIIPEEAEYTTEGVVPCRFTGVIRITDTDPACSVFIHLSTGHILYPVNLDDFASGLQDGQPVKLSFTQLNRSPDNCLRAIPVSLSCLSREGTGTRPVSDRVN